MALLGVESRDRQVQCGSRRVGDRAMSVVGLWFWTGGGKAVCFVAG